VESRFGGLRNRYTPASAQNQEVTMRTIIHSGISVIICGSLALTACAPTRSTQESAKPFPDRPIELVVPFDAGGGTDLTARAIAGPLSNELGVPVNVVNKPGAEQATGVDYVRKSKPDGYTLLADGASSSSIQSLNHNLPFAWGDRTFIGRLTSGAHAYVVAANSPYKTLDELIDGIKLGKKKFKANYYGGSVTSDLALLMLLKEAGVSLSDLTLSSYTSAGDVLKAVTASNLDFGVVGASATYKFVSSGELRVLAQTGSEPMKQLPGAPTSAKAGHPELDLTFWVGLSGPPGIPQTVRRRLEWALLKMASDARVQEKLDKVGVVADVMVGDDFEQYVRSEATTFKELRENVGESK
jgi:tripartite-type tricarboxylate transporter receptor subunit TctC